MDLTSLHEDAAVMDLLLQDLAQRPVDTTDPPWTAELAARLPPAEEAGVMAEATAAPPALLDADESGTSAREVAAMSSDVDHYGMGSTRLLLMRGPEKH